MLGYQPPTLPTMATARFGTGEQWGRTKRRLLLIGQEEDSLSNKRHFKSRRAKDSVIPTLTDTELDELIAITDNAMIVNRQARIERGKRMEALPTGAAAHASVTPGVTLTGTERKKRSEERIVAEYDPTVEEVTTVGWKKLVTKARAKRGESLCQRADSTTIGANSERR